jgi:hydrogenase nickel incorporation protein HypA/HybF
MHELALCESVLKILESSAESHRFRRVTVVRLDIGALACVSPEALDFCFQAVARGSVAEGATLEIRRVPGRACCLACGATIAVASREDDCLECGSYALQVAGGDDMRVSELEVD